MAQSVAVTTLAMFDPVNVHSPMLRSLHPVADGRTDSGH